MDQIESKISSIEDRINESTETNIKKINNMKEQLAKIQRTIEDEKSTRDQYFELRDKQLKNFEFKIIEKLDAESMVIFDIRIERK